MATVRYSRLLIAVGLGVFMVASSMGPAIAQCSDCWNTPTPTPTGTWTPPSPTPTPTGPYPLPSPIGLDFPNYPVPTSIPALQFPGVPDPIEFTPIPAPSPISLDITPIPTPNYPPITSTPSPTPIPLNSISTTLSLSYTIPLKLDTSGGVTGSAAYTAVSGILITGTDFVSGVVSYTGWLSGEVASLQATQTFTIATAPAWYAPDLPRPMADIGWTFETLQSGIDSGTRYSLQQWAWFAGYVSSLPIQLIKLLFQIFQFLGPLGLFVIWLLIMFPLVLFVKFFVFVKNLFISLLNFILKIIRFILDIIGIFT